MDCVAERLKRFVPWRSDKAGSARNRRASGKPMRSRRYTWRRVARHMGHAAGGDIRGLEQAIFPEVKVVLRVRPDERALRASIITTVPMALLGSVFKPGLAGAGASRWSAISRRPRAKSRGWARWVESEFWPECGPAPKRLEAFRYAIHRMRWDWRATTLGFSGSEMANGRRPKQLGSLTPAALRRGLPLPLGAPVWPSNQANTRNCPAVSGARFGSGSGGGRRG